MNTHRQKWAHILVGLSCSICSCSQRDLVDDESSAANEWLASGAAIEEAFKGNDVLVVYDALSDVPMTPASNS